MGYLSKKHWQKDRSKNTSRCMKIIFTGKYIPFSKEHPQSDGFTHRSPSNTSPSGHRQVSIQLAAEQLNDDETPPQDSGHGVAQGSYSVPFGHFSSVKGIPFRNM